MSYAETALYYQVMGGASMLGTFAVALVAIVVAVVLTIRRQCVVAAWLLAVSWTGAWLVDVSNLLVGVILAPAQDVELISWAYLGLRVVTLVMGLVAALALALMRPGAREAVR